MASTTRLRSLRLASPWGKTANVSVSLRGASTIATDTAQIILMDGSLNSLVQVFDIAAEMQQNMKGNLFATIVPSVVTIGGAFFLHFGVLSAIWLYNVGLLAGVANAMRPMITYKRKEASDIEEVRLVDSAKSGAF